MSDLAPIEIEMRRAARERALELLYETEAKRSDIDAVLADLPIDPAPLAVELVRGVETHRVRIDEMLARRVAPRWTLARLASVDRAILRLATYELIDVHDRSLAVIINEAVVLARRFGTDDSPRFVNGVLSAVAKEVRNGDEPLTDATADAEAEAAAAVLAVRQERTVDAVVIDLDGVIRHWDDDQLPEYEENLGLPTGAISAAAFEPERLGRAMRGEITADDWYAEIGKAVAGEHPVEADDVAQLFASIGWRIDESVLELVDEARKQVPVVLLSNASTRLQADLELSRIADRFDAVVGSADVGFVKPDAGAFKAAVAKAGVPAGRCLMIDDLSDNIVGAKAAGLQAVQFTDIDELAAALVAAGVIAPGH
jgi:putative hydrolase of the HAD superfamily